MHMHMHSKLALEINMEVYLLFRVRLGTGTGAEPRSVVVWLSSTTEPLSVRRRLARLCRAIVVLGSDWEVDEGSSSAARPRARRRVADELISGMATRPSRDEPWLGDDDHLCVKGLEKRIKFKVAALPGLEGDSRSGCKEVAVVVVDALDEADKVDDKGEGEDEDADDDDDKKFAEAEVGSLGVDCEAPASGRLVSLGWLLALSRRARADESGAAAWTTRRLAALCCWRKRKLANFRSRALSMKPRGRSPGRGFG